MPHIIRNAKVLTVAGGQGADENRFHRQTQRSFSEAVSLVMERFLLGKARDGAGRQPEGLVFGHLPGPRVETRAQSHSCQELS
jgi:hypothetical protein